MYQDVVGTRQGKFAIVPRQREFYGHLQVSLRIEGLGNYRGAWLIRNSLSLGNSLPLQRVLRPPPGSWIGGLGNEALGVEALEGYLADKKQPPPKNLQWPYA